MAQGHASLGMCGMGAVCGLCMNRYNMRECVHSKKNNNNKEKRKCGAWRLTPPCNRWSYNKDHSDRFFSFFLFAFISEPNEACLGHGTKSPVSGTGQLISWLIRPLSEHSWSDLEAAVALPRHICDFATTVANT